MKKLWNNIIYYIYYTPKEFYYNIKWFFENLWRFRKQLWSFRTWDFSFCNELFADSLEWLSKNIENGHEEERSAIKKVNAINELVILLRKLTDGTEFGMENDPEFWKDNHRITSDEEYNNEYERRRDVILDRILEIIKGQHNSDFDSIKDIKYPEYYDKYVEIFDGTGYEGWWD